MNGKSEIVRAAIAVKLQRRRSYGVAVGKSAADKIANSQVDENEANDAGPDIERCAEECTQQTRCAHLKCQTLSYRQ